MNLEDYREQLDQIDNQILDFLHQRIGIVEKIGYLKRQNSRESDQDFHVYAPHREKQIVDRLCQQNRNRFPAGALEKIYSEIISACRSIEKPMRIAFLGPVATFGHAAGIAHFGSSVEFVPITPQSDIFAEVEAKRVDYGIIAIENSIYGSVRDVLEMFHNTSLQICGERLMRIDHNLMSASSLPEINKIYSHAQALAQCRRWIKQNLPHVELVQVLSTSEAAQLTTSEKGAAAIASKLASQYHQLPIVAESIMDNASNMTRFLIIGHHIAEPTGRDRTSILIGLRDQVGSLASVLTVLCNHHLNMSKIESLPSRHKAWEYVFFVDFNGHLADEKVQAALPVIEERSVFLKVLGSYPIAHTATKN